MKFLLYLLTIGNIFLFVSCDQRGSSIYSPQSKETAAYGNNYGGPAARISKEPISGAIISGPLAYAPHIPAVSTEDIIDVRLDVQHKMVTVSRGVQVMAWVFGDSVPGPVLHIKQGQTIRFKMSNRSLETATISPPMQHSIDFHAAMVNPEDKYKSVNPGETITFEWTANYPGVFMYHCGTPLILQHMIQGMFGMVIVQPGGGFPGHVDKEFALVQHEWYLKEKENGSYVIDLESARKKLPMFVAFNGKPRMHVKNPLVVKAGDRVRLYVCNTGPNDQSSFHVVGVLFDKVWIDGNPANEMRGMQTVLLPAGGSSIVEFVIPEKGIYTFVDHEFADVESGAAGLIKAE
jgi:nitrite reductase (NO-forming)